MPLANLKLIICTIVSAKYVKPFTKKCKLKYCNSYVLVTVSGKGMISHEKQEVPGSIRFVSVLKGSVPVRFAVLCGSLWTW